MCPRGLSLPTASTRQGNVSPPRLSRLDSTRLDSTRLGRRPAAPTPAPAVSTAGSRLLLRPGASPGPGPRFSFPLSGLGFSGRVSRSAGAASRARSRLPGPSPPRGLRGSPRTRRRGKTKDPPPGPGHLLLLPGAAAGRGRPPRQRWAWEEGRSRSGADGTREGAEVVLTAEPAPQPRSRRAPRPARAARRRGGELRGGGSSTSPAPSPASFCRRVRSATPALAPPPSAERPRRLTYRSRALRAVAPRHSLAPPPRPIRSRRPGTAPPPPGAEDAGFRPGREFVGCTRRQAGGLGGPQGQKEESGWAWGSSDFREEAEPGAGRDPFVGLRSCSAPSPRGKPGGSYCLPAFVWGWLSFQTLLQAETLAEACTTLARTVQQLIAGELPRSPPRALPGTGDWEAEPSRQGKLCEVREVAELDLDLEGEEFGGVLPVVIDRNLTWTRICSPRTCEQMKRKWEVTVKQIEERAAHYEKNPLSSKYRPRLSKSEEPPSIWKLFHRQAQAFNFVKSCKEDVHVFALEYKGSDGQRVYLVTTYTELWFYYKFRKNLLHCYEVIPENAVCKLYFDLEFNKLVNPGADGKKMVALLIEHVCKALQELYKVHCSAEDVFNLDSSTDEKFSRHLIFQLHDVAFKDNAHVGNFVRKILQPAFHLIASEDDHRIEGTTAHGFSHYSETSVRQGVSFSKISTEEDTDESWTPKEKLERLTSAEKSNSDLSFLVVKNNLGEKQLFVDLGVYTRNRNFRLYKSSKIGKHATLKIAEDNKFVPKQFKNVSEENQYFLSSLVSNVRFSDTLRILTCDTPQIKEKGVEYFNSANTSVETIEGFQCSPYPEIDHFVLSLVNKNGIKGGIRRWTYFFPEELLVYDICKYRWCENIGRAHKSNNIMILVDLKNEIWYQKCHDPVCKAENFKSECVPLPAEVSLLFILREEEELMTDQTTNNEAKNLHKPSSSTLSTEISSDANWNDDTDDTYFLEATEDAELAEATEFSLLSYNSGVDEIPDELIIEVLQDEKSS